MTTRLMLVLAALLVTSATPAAEIPVDDLTRDVNAIDSGGNPATMIVWGDAEALCVAPDGRVFAAAGTLERGRVVVVGHGGFLSTNDADSEVFAANAIAWLIEGRRRDGTLRIHGVSDPLGKELQRRRIGYLPLGGAARDVRFGDLDVLIGSPQRFAKAGRLDELAAWLRAGGRMLVAETAWGQLQLNPELTIDTLAANQLLGDAGIRFTDQAHSAFGPDGAYPIQRDRLALGNADRALDVLAGERDGDAALAARVVGDAFARVPLDAPLIRRAQRLQRVHADELAAIYGGLKTQRLTARDHPLARALIDLDSRLGQELSPRRVTAHASSVAFPGRVGDTRAGRVTVTIDPSIPGWHSTGLYAAPGEVIRVRTPDAVVDAGVVVQIGAWRDPHAHGYRSRLAQALRRVSVTERMTETASAIGGPIYLDLPVGAALGTAPLEFEIIGAARAPFYQHGVTGLDAWRDTIRHYDAPWAEFGSDDLIFTVPSAAIRDVDRPDLVMAHWNRVHEAMQALEPRTANHWADRPYRYVADISISHGYMYCPANGPIAIPVSASPEMFRLEHFDAEGPNELWGHYHEMGHAHQHPRWTDGATTEVTVNIFTVYALHVVNGYPLDSDVMRSTPADAWATFNDHRATGARYEDVGGPFPRLQYYALLWHAFGFDAFHETFDRIRALADDPESTSAERNTFIATFSEVVGRSLVPYAEAWGIEVTDSTRKRLAELEPWMPVAPTVAGE